MRERKLKELKQAMRCCVTTIAYDMPFPHNLDLISDPDPKSVSESCISRENRLALDRRAGSLLGCLSY